MNNSQLINQTSGQVEWYTPSHIVEAARRTMGTIDLDPASSDVANEIIQASNYFTVFSDGLKQPWHGNVWLNHPYGRKENCQWVEKAIYQYKYGAIDQLCMIVFASTSERWFQPLYDYPMCFINGRVKFIDVMDTNRTSPSKGSAVVYMGPNRNRFAEEFGELGRVLVTVDQNERS